MTITYRLEGGRVQSIDDLYAEFNRLFMSGADWDLGPSLDGLNDVLYGVAAQEDSPVRVIWADHAHTSEALGTEATRAWLESKLAQPDRFSMPLLRQQLDDLRHGTGKTYFEIVLEIFAEHSGIELDLR